MESSTCRRRASEAEQAAWAYSMTAECGPLKEEPEWDERGVSESAGAEGLYAGHEVKDELVFGPELLQPQDIAFSMQSAQKGIDESTHAQPEEGPRCNMSTKQHIHGGGIFKNGAKEPQTSRKDYKNHQYSGPRKSRKRSRGQMKRYHGENVKSRTEVWCKKKKTNDYNDVPSSSM